MKKYHKMQKITKEISELWCRNFGVLKYFKQKITVFEDASILIDLSFSPELLEESLYEATINEIEELILSYKLNYELFNDETKLIFEI